MDSNMDKCDRHSFFKGLRVKIISTSGNTVEGIVSKVITVISYDPNGIFVELETGESGTTIEILQNEQEIIINKMKSDFDGHRILGESNEVEFKESYMYPINDPLKSVEQVTKEDKLLIKYIIAKTIAAFANANGGTLYIGVQDRTNKIMGLEKDFSLLDAGKQDSDGLEIRMTSDLPTFFTKRDLVFQNTKLHFIKVENKDICVVKVTRSDVPFITLKDTKEEMYVRQNNSSKKYEKVSEFIDYWVNHIHKS